MAVRSRGGACGFGWGEENMSSDDFETGTRTIRRWVAGETVSTNALIEELRHWVDYFAPEPKAAETIADPALLSPIAPGEFG